MESMYLLGRLSTYLYVFMFCPAIINMFLNKNARHKVLLYVIFLNAVFIILYNFLSKKIISNGDPIAKNSGVASVIVSNGDISRIVTVVANNGSTGKLGGLSEAIAAPRLNT